jgi:hypothetical protein
MMRALKEWSSVVRALGEGRQHVIIRKGGILEAASGFKFDSPTFALFPTREHQDVGDLKPEFARYAAEPVPGGGDGHETVSFYAEVQCEVETGDASVVESLSGMHAWSDDFVRRRMAWRPEKPVRAALLRVYAAAEPARVKLGPEHAGCKSWVDIGQDLGAGRPVVDDGRAAGLESEFRRLVSA